MTIHIKSQVGTLTCSNKLQKKAIRSIRLANIKGTSEVLSAAADDDDDEEDDNDNDDQEDDNEDGYEEVDNDNDETKDDGEADDETGDGEEADDNDDDIDENDKQEGAKVSLKSIMLANVGSLKLGSSVVEMEFLKLINSSCINLISNKYRELYQEVIPLNTFQHIWRTCNTNKREYQASCQARTKELINELFDDLKQFQFE